MTKLYPTKKERKMEKLKAESNFKKICIIRVIRSGMFSIPIIVLFFAENGVNLKEAIVLQSLFSLASILFEIPTGYFADRYSRKLSIILGGVFSTGGFFFYSVSSDFYGFLIAEVILALGMSFISGADGALLFDTQNEMYDSGAGIALEGRSRSFGMLSEAITSLVGGSILATISLRLPIYFDAVFSSLVIVVALTLVEPKRKNIKKRESALITLWKVMRFSLHDHKEVKSLIYFSAIASAATLNMVWFIQPYWSLTGIPIFWFGLGWSFFQIMGAGFSHHANEIEKVLKKKSSLLLIILSSIVGYFFLGAFSFFWSSLFIVPFYLSRGLNEPITRNYINLSIPEKDRATILSIKSLMGRLIFSIIGPIMGWISETTSLQCALITSGIIFGVLGFWSWWQLLRHKALD